MPEERRAAYHAAASIASNLLVALEESAAELLDRIGVEDARELLAPLVLRTAANWAERGPRGAHRARSRAATRRPSSDTWRRCAMSLRSSLPLYEALAERARELARSVAEAPA